jgi:hypothetical protein
MKIIILRIRFLSKSLLVIGMAISTLLNAQTDSTLLARLTKPVVVDCENIAFNSQEVISAFSIEQADSIRLVLDFWKKNCENSEPIRRVELLLAISDGSFTDSAFVDYNDQLARDYYWRFQDSQRLDYAVIYQNNKASYHFVPLRSALDAWSVRVAEQLLAKVPEKSAEYLYCLLLSNRFTDYERCVTSRDYSQTLANQEIEKKFVEAWKKGFFGGFSAGMWVPVMKLSQTFSNSPELGLRFGMPLGKDFRLEAKALIRFFMQDKSFQFFAYDSVYTTGGDIGGFLGFNLSKECFVSSELAVNLHAGLGLGFVDTDIEKPEEEWTYDQNGTVSNRYYGVETFDLNLGAGFRKRIFKTNSIGMELSYHFAPYQIDEDLVSNFGDQYVSLAFVYLF